GSPPTKRNPSLGWGFCFSGGASLEYCRQSGDSRLDQCPLFFGCLPCAHPYLTALLRLWTHNMLKTMLPRLLSFMFALLFLSIPSVGAQSVDKVELDPEQARQVLDTLQDEERREDVVRALE